MHVVRLEVESAVARALLEIGAVGFMPRQPITFKSGMKAPVYVDNRRLPFWPSQWQIIINAFQRVITEQQISFDVIAGIESGGIPHSSALGFSLQKPSIFVRKETKEHGTRKRIEGGDIAGKHVLLIEDHVTTGGSSLSGVAALREAGAIVEHCLSIMSYEFSEAQEAFHEAGVQLRSLASFTVILGEALRMGIFGQEEAAIIGDWFADPRGWAARHGF